MEGDGEGGQQQEKLVNIVEQFNSGLSTFWPRSSIDDASPVSSSWLDVSFKLDAILSKIEDVPETSVCEDYPLLLPQPLPLPVAVDEADLVCVDSWLDDSFHLEAISCRIEDVPESSVCEEYPLPLPLPLPVAVDEDELECVDVDSWLADCGIPTGGGGFDDEQEEEEEEEEELVGDGGVSQPVGCSDESDALDGFYLQDDPFLASCVGWGDVVAVPDNVRRSTGRGRGRAFSPHISDAELVHNLVLLKRGHRLESLPNLIFKDVYRVSGKALDGMARTKASPQYFLVKTTYSSPTGKRITRIRSDPSNSSVCRRWMQRGRSKRFVTGNAVYGKTYFSYSLRDCEARRRKSKQGGEGEGEGEEEEDEEGTTSKNNKYQMYELFLKEDLDAERRMIKQRKQPSPFYVICVLKYGCKDEIISM